MALWSHPRGLSCSHRAERDILGRGGQRARRGDRLGAGDRVGDHPRRRSLRPRAGQGQAGTPSATQVAACPKPTKVLGGGEEASTGYGTIDLRQTYPADLGDGNSTPEDGWSVVVFNRSGAKAPISVVAACGKTKVGYVQQKVHLIGSSTAQEHDISCPAGQYAVSGGVKGEPSLHGQHVPVRQLHAQRQLGRILRLAQSIEHPDVVCPLHAQGLPGLRAQPSKRPQRERGRRHRRLPASYGGLRGRHRLERRPPRRRAQLPGPSASRRALAEAPWTPSWTSTPRSRSRSRSSPPAARSSDAPAARPPALRGQRRGLEPPTAWTTTRSSTN